MDNSKFTDEIYVRCTSSSKKNWGKMAMEIGHSGIPSLIRVTLNEKFKQWRAEKIKNEVSVL